MASDRQIGKNCPECGRPLDDPGPRVKVKRFCSAECRSRWHGRVRQEAWEKFKASQGGIKP